MPQTQIADVVVPAEFSAYIVENSVVSTALFQSGVLVRNNYVSDALSVGSTLFQVPFWRDIANDEADITSDDPTVLSTPKKFTAGRQIVRKSFLHQSWAEMSLAAELSGSSPLEALKGRVSAYWDRQCQARLVATLLGVLGSNVASNAGDMVNDISGQSGAAANFNGGAVIDTALSMGDRLNDFKAIAMHSHIYGEALKNNEIEFFKPSDNSIEFATYKGMAVVISDSLTPANGVYTTILMGPGAIGFGASEPNTGYGIEIHRVPDSGNGGGQTVLHSRLNVALHPLGYAWNDGTGENAIAGESPTIADLVNSAHWSRVSSSRKNVPLAFLISM